MHHACTGLAALLGLALLPGAACRVPAGERPDPRSFSTLQQRSGLEPADDHELPPPPVEPEAHDLASYRRFALAASRPLRVAHARWQAMDARVDVAGSLPAPRLGFTEFVRELETRTGPQARRLGLAQTLPWPGKRAARADAARGAAAAAWHALEREALATCERVTQAYQEWALLGTERRLARENLALLRQLEPVVQTRILTGGRQEDLLRLQLEIAQLEDRLASLADQGRAHATRLAAAMGHDRPADLPWPELVAPQEEELALDAALLLEAARESSPELARAASELERASAELEDARLARLPDVTLGVDWFVTEPGMAGVPDRGEDPLSVSLGLDLPVWGSRYDGAERAARHQVRAARLELDRAGELLDAELESTAFALRDAARTMALHRDSLLPRVREELELTLASYRAGSATLFDLIDTERRQLAFERAYWRACRDGLLARARLETLVGRTL